MKDSELKDRKVRNLQAEAIHDLMKSLKTVFGIAHAYNDVAKKNRWKENPTMQEIEKECLRGLHKLDKHSLALEEMRREIPKQQRRLVD